MITKLYIMHAGDFIKVGVTSGNVEKRAKQVQTGCPLPIEDVLYICFNTRSEAYMAEKSVHDEFAGYNSYGEWFFKFSKYTTKICKTIGKQTSDVKSIRIIPKEVFTNTETAKKRIRYRQMKEEGLDMEIKHPERKEEIRHHFRLTDAERQRKIEKALKNNPLLEGIINGN